METDRHIYRGRIIQDPKILVGKPVIRGTRIPVERVIAHLAQEPDLSDLLAAYPELSVEDVRASLEYAHAAMARECSVSDQDVGLAERLVAIGKDCAAHLKEPQRSGDHGELLYDERGLPR